MMNKLFTILFVVVIANKIASQSTFPCNGAPFITHSIYAFVNATIIADEETTIKNGILLIQDGKILNVGEKLEIPKNAIVYDLKGKYIYSSFIDLYSDYGMPEIKQNHRNGFGPQMESNIKGAYGWNQAIKADVEAYKQFTHNKDKANELKKLGIGAVVTCPKDGIVRGSGAFVLLNNSSKENESIITDKAAAFYSLNKGSSTQDYPSSLTGCIALLRQTYYDAQWYKLNQNKTEYNISLEVFNKLQDLTSIFEGNDKFNDMRAAKIGKEFNIKYIVKGGGNEYQRINDIQNTFLKYIIPVNFPDAYDVEDPYDAESITLAELKHWELAPTNPAAFEKNNIPFCFTSADLKNKSDFLKNIRKAIQYGLSEKTALKALTTNPASFINASNKIGALKKDYIANFFISSKSIFDEDAEIIQHWVKGEANIYAEINPIDIRGNYNLVVNAKNYKVKFYDDVIKPKAQIVIDTVKKNINYSFTNNLLMFSFMLDSMNIVRASGNYNVQQKSFEGNLQLADGKWSSFKLAYESMVDTSKKISPKTKKKDSNLGKVIYPFNAYGEPLPEENGFFKDSWNKFKNRYSAILIKNATVWTNDGDSVLKNTDVYIVDGKIVRIAPNIEAPKLAYAKIIDAQGKHLTPGIIDEHSHIALTSGVNEGTQASSAEVRMGDVINPEDINIYRNLSGGVTCIQQLHGSANPIGGQSSIIKLRWGHNAEDMKYDKADGFIKFALGENVKQSNWGDFNSVRFPQSRMGVEQVYNDYFTRAKEYNKAMEAFLTSKDKNKISPRKDLELEAIGEILAKKRFITCHSYVQSEINMLMHVADTFGFKVNTFTHILEGYKVADKMKTHGVNASTFSDWWAYKNEVMEAIPYNAAVLTKVGVNTSINSDDAEMARRLNQEAAKSVKYGSLTEVEALKMVTLNPAIMLHIDDKVGSIKVGKVADVVLWTDNPLSVYAKADKTIIDGQIYFDRDEDAKLQEYIKTEKARIITKLLMEKQKGGKTQKHQTKQQRLYHCNTIEGVNEEETGIR
ncbi:MAG: amidohydrolase family protein [Bacteroidota bacterium]|nr:amidohydrolase family protein [Bacteroidota bacterium]